MNKSTLQGKVLTVKLGNMRPPTLANFVHYGVMGAADEMQYMVKTEDGKRMLTATVGKHPRNWLLFVQLTELGGEDIQREILQNCCERYDEVEPKLSTSEYIAVAMSTFVHIGRMLSGEAGGSGKP